MEKTKLYAWLKGVIIATITCSIVVTTYIGLMQWYITPASANNFTITDVYQLSDGSISYRLNANDGYQPHYIVYTYDEFGDTYMLGYRPIIKDKGSESRFLDKGLHIINPMQEEIWRIEVVPTDANGRPSMQLITETSGNKAWYYGTDEDKILIWQEGMEVPKASGELENYWLEWR